ncbi:tripartite tricarboxylate transporter permease [Pelagibius sp. Alg239-R121]|uniref:tripartite tricarboxylate transporter permease n=1 Tax=Pelagibius sp. Alg239-R121 TaxID=2993448 RepID=UPI0024A63AC9|nr:tripartite tricarboxylate transporter permease [Pelagibius sp. Alg239-R121]
MIENLTEAFFLFLSFENILVIFIGVLIGTIIGAIPGMTTPMGVALALPFTFTMHPVTGILLLLGVYKGGLYGGSITAILLKAPGTPAASCTVLDGFPMAQRGEARRALDMALYASCFADFVSNLSLILLTGFLASFALRFGPPEFFTLIVFSLTIISGVSGDRLSKGIVSACLGLLLATIGLDIIYGTERFIFGEYELMSGLNFIPVLIGLFALPEIINHYAKKNDGHVSVGALGKVGATFAEFRSCFKSILRGSLIGVVLGAIPGIGGAPSAFLSYSEARRTSKNKENFGKGEIEGVAAAEAGNNGVAGATMIPLLALGVPGDVITAVILGAFMIHGLKPGPVMFEQNLTMIYAIFIGIMLSSAYLFVIGKCSIRTISRISDVPNNLLYPIVLVLCIFGAYAVNNSLFDILVMSCMGIVGFTMLRLEVPAAPFLIAFILGPLLEDNFRQSLLLSDGSYGIFFHNAICWVFWALTALSIFLVVRSHIRDSRAKAKASTTAEAART